MRSFLIASGIITLLLPYTVGFGQVGNTDSVEERNEAFGLATRLAGESHAPAASGAPAGAPVSGASVSGAPVSGAPVSSPAPVPAGPASTSPSAVSPTKPEKSGTAGLSSGASPVTVKEVEVKPAGRTTESSRIEGGSGRASVPAGGQTARRSNVEEVRTESRPATDDRMKSPAAAPTPKRHRQDKIALLAQMQEQSSPAKQSATGSVKAVAWTMLKLAFVLVLAYCCILALKRLSGKREVSPRGTQDLHVVDTVRLSPTASLHLVNARGKVLLVGCSTGQVNLLQEVSADEIPEAEAETGGRFAEYLARYSSPGGSATPAGRLAGLLRDCTGYLRSRYGSSHVKTGDDNGA